MDLYTQLEIKEDYKIRVDRDNITFTGNIY